MFSPATYASSGFYLYLSSVDSVDYFPSNTSDNFIVKFPELYKLPGHWEVALTEIHLPARAGWTAESFSVYRDICEETVMGGKKEPVLRKLFNTTEEATFSQYYYIPVMQKQRGGSARKVKGLRGIHTRKNGHCVYIARPDSAQRGGAAQQQQQQQQGGAASGNICSKVELVRPEEQTSEIALSELKDKEDKERYFSQLLQLAVNGQRGKKRKRAAQQSTQKGGKKTANSSRSSSWKKQEPTRPGQKYQCFNNHGSC